MEVLRIGMGVVWALNLVFVLYPPNQYFPTFESTARSFAPTTLGGPGVAGFVGAHASAFAWGIALLTGFLAVAFLLGALTRWACAIGAAASAVFLLTQFTSTFGTPGGTDVGPHPLYLLVYAVLVVGGAGSTWAIDRGMRDAWGVRHPRLTWWLTLGVLEPLARPKDSGEDGTSR